MSTWNQKLGVLVMAYGGPNSLSEIPGYLADIRHGRTTGKRILDEISKNYQAIGGKSSLLETATKQKDLLAEALGNDYHVYLGMRHWAPWIEDTVREMLRDGITTIIGIVLAPHHSQVSIDAYHKRVREALKMYHSNASYIPVQNYHTNKNLIEGFALNIKKSIGNKKTHLLMSAHSIPKHFQDRGDTYHAQLLETASAVADTLGLDKDDWSFAFQSKGRSQEEWLSPAIEEHLPTLHSRGITHVTILPIGFLSDHVEILYDIDIKAIAFAREIGITLERADTLKTSPKLIRALEEAVRAHANSNHEKGT